MPCRTVDITFAALVILITPTTATQFGAEPVGTITKQGGNFGSYFGEIVDARWNVASPATTGSPLGAMRYLQPEALARRVLAIRR